MRLFGFISLLALLGCAEPEIIPFNNPLMPGDPEYIPMVVSIVSSPDDYETLSTNETSIAWTGNYPGMLYSHRLDNMAWSDWSADTTTTLKFLDEGLHSFSIMGKYYEVYTRGGAAKIYFITDYIRGPAVWLRPQHQTVDVTGLGVVSIMLEDVSQLKSISVRIQYDTTAARILDVTLLDGAGTLISASLGTTEAIVNTDTAGIASIDLSFRIGASGSGAIARIGVLVTKSTTLKIHPSVLMRDTENEEIVVILLVNAEIEKNN